MSILDERHEVCSDLHERNQHQAATQSRAVWRWYHIICMLLAAAVAQERQLRVQNVSAGTKVGFDRKAQDTMKVRERGLVVLKF